MGDLRQMRIDEYQELALMTANPEALQDIRHKLTNGALGLLGEAGEVADHIKKYLYQGHMLDRDTIAKELGDVSWYIALLCDAIKMDYSEILKRNIEKLQYRYPDGFEESKSINRAKDDN